MRKVRIIFLFLALLSTQSIFADMMDDDSKPCATIANACIDGGYVRKETPDKKFWQDCMKPVLLGKTVQGVTVDAHVVKSCRTDKISDMKKLLKELQHASK